MKKLFAGLLVGTLAVAGQMTVFAATEDQNLSAEMKSIESIAITDIQKVNLGEEATMLTASVEAINIEDMTPEQVAEMEKAQKAFENRIQEVCKKAGYDFKTMMDHFEKGTLTDEEQEILIEAGIMMATTVVESTEAVQLTDDFQVEELKDRPISEFIQAIEMTSIQK